MIVPTWDDAIRALRWQYGEHGAADWLERNKPNVAGDIDWNAESRRLSSGLLAIHAASDAATMAALKSVAYDIALNCINAETAAFQIERRSKENPAPAQAGLTAGGGSGSANVSEGVTGGGECAVGDAAGEIGGRLEMAPVGDPAAGDPAAAGWPVGA